MKILKLIFVLALTLGVVSLGFTAEAKRIATITELKGVVEVKVPKQPWIPASVGMLLNQGDLIRTKAKSSAILNLDAAAQTATVEVKEGSQLALAELLEDKATASQITLLDLALGEILIKAKKLHSEKSRFEVKTPTSIVGVRGTKFSVTVKAIE